MKCEEIRELMPDLAAGLTTGLTEMTPAISQHLESCGVCAAKLEEFRRTMALLDEWQAPEPSPYFDVRLQARLREEIAKPQIGWFGWFRRPVLAAALTVLMAAGIGLFLKNDSGDYKQPDDTVAVNELMTPGTAVSDLSALEKNHDLYSDFDLLDDMQVQPDVVENP